jgi:hypothetical protein
MNDRRVNVSIVQKRKINAKRVAYGHQASSMFLSGSFVILYGFQVSLQGLQGSMVPG